MVLSSIIPTSWHPFPSLVLSADRRDTQILQITWTVSSQMFVRLRLSSEIHLLLKLFLRILGRRCVASSPRMAPAMSGVTCCTNVVTSLTGQSRSKSVGPGTSSALGRTRLIQRGTS